MMHIINTKSQPQYIDTEINEISFEFGQVIN